jgi:adenylate kinase family enzyme
MNSEVDRYQQQPTRTLIIVGYSGAGKTTLGSLLHRDTGVPVIEIGKLVRAEAAAQTPPLSAPEYANQVLSQGNHLHFVKQVVSRHRGSRPLIVVGPRLPQELCYLRAELAPSITMALHTPATVRASRGADLEAQADGVDGLRIRDQIERSWGLDRTIEMADARFDGLDSPEILAAKVGQLWVSGIPEKLKGDST